MSGTARASAFSATATTMLVYLYRLAPIDGANAVAVQAVGSDGSWGFDTASASIGADAGWGHYYVQLAVAFGEHTVSGTVGPLAAPATGPTAFELEPVRASVFESEGQFLAATVHVFDPSSGAEIMDDAGTLTLAVGDASLPLIWDQAQMAYATAPSSPASDAQATAMLAAPAAYTLTVTHPALGPTPTTWPLAAHEPNFTGQVLSPAPDASVDGGDLVVQWKAEPSADYVQVDVYGPETDGSATTWPRVYHSQPPDESDVTEETVPASTFYVSLPDGGGPRFAAGTYLVNVVYAQVNCAPGSAGCVYSATAAAENVDVTSAAGDAAL